MSPASNTHECFTELIGRKVVGVLFGALPYGRHDISRHCTTLVLDDGTGFTFSHKHGSYWQESADEIALAIEAKQSELAIAQSEIESVLALAGRDLGASQENAT